MVGMIVAVGSGNGRKREEATLKHPSLYVHEYVFYSFFVHIVFRAWHVLVVLTIASVVIHIAEASVLRPGTLATSCTSTQGLASTLLGWPLAVASNSCSCMAC